MRLVIFDFPATSTKRRPGNLPRSPPTIRELGEKCSSSSRLLQVLRLGELALGSFEAAIDRLVEMPSFGMSFKKAVLGIMNDQMDLGLPSDGRHVELRSIKIGMQTDEVLVALLQDLLGTRLEMRVLSFEVLREFIDRFHDCIVVSRHSHHESTTLSTISSHAIANR